MVCKASPGASDDVVSGAGDIVVSWTLCSPLNKIYTWYCDAKRKQCEEDGIDESAYAVQ